MTIVHSGSMLLSAVYPDKFRKDIERRCRAQGIDVVLGEYVDQIPASGTTGLTTRSGRTFTTADLVVRSHRCLRLLFSSNGRNF